MTECLSARCQQDRKIIRREFNKWTKNLLLQIGLETISKDHFEFDPNLFDENKSSITVDFDPDRACLFCVNRHEILGNKKSTITTQRTNLNFDDDENAPLDLSTKSNNRPNVNKHRPFFDIKSDMPPIYSNNDDFDRLMSDIIASQMNLTNSHLSFDNLNLNLFPVGSSRKPSTVSMDFRIAQSAKQMAYERMLEEIAHHRHGTMKKKYSSTTTPLNDSLHVNHILNDVMMRIVHELFEKHQQTPPVRASRKGELLFVKKPSNNQDESSMIYPNHSMTSKTSSSSSSSTSSVSSSHSKKKSSSNVKYIPRTRTIDNNSKVLIGQDGKQIRPKRGQYRRYESEQLAKAVAAVLSNEMSVHKAGSYFGVPHSTLEYKVKERNIKSSSTTKVKTPVPSPSDEDEERMDCQ